MYVTLTSDYCPLVLIFAINILNFKTIFLSNVKIKTYVFNILEN